MPSIAYAALEAGSAEIHGPTTGSDVTISNVARQFLEDAFGPDGVRVTICVELSVDRWVRARDRWTVPNPWSPVDRWLRRQLPRLAQTAVFGGTWAVEVEADSGERARATRASRDEAVALARSIWHEVNARGIAALTGLE